MSSTVYSTQRISDIGGNGEADMLQFHNVIPSPLLGKSVLDRTKHPRSGITGGTAPESDEDMSGSSTHSVGHQLARSIACGYQRIPFVFRQQRQTTGTGNLYYRSLVLQQIGCRNGTHQRVSNHNIYCLAADGRLKSLQEALAAVAYRYLYDFRIRTNTSYAFRCCLIRLHGTQAAFERINRYDNLHKNK